MNKKVNSLYFISSKSLFILLLFPILSKLSMIDLIITIVTSTLTGTILIYIYNEIDLSNKYISFILGFLSIVVMCYVLNPTILFINDLYMHRFSYLIPGIILLYLLYQIQLSDKEVLKKISDLSLYIFIFVLAITIISLVPNISLDNFYYHSTNNYNLLNVFIRYLLLTVFPILLIDSNKNNILTSYLLSNTYILLFTIFTISVLGINLINIYDYPFIILLQKVTRLELILSYTYLLDLFIILSIILIFIKKCLNIKRNWIIISLLIMILSVSYFLSNYLSMFILILSIISILIPLFLFAKKLIRKY